MLWVRSFLIVKFDVFSAIKICESITSKYIFSELRIINEKLEKIVLVKKGITLGIQK